MSRLKGQKDTKPRQTAARKAAALAAEEGLTPLQFMLRTMRDPKQKWDRRYAAAVSAAPYVHPRLANVQHRAPDDDGVFRFEIVSVPPATA